MLNTITLVGRLTDNPKSFKGKDGNVVSFYLAFTQGVEDTGFVKCVTFNANADTCEKYVHKGDKVGVTGRFYDKVFEREDKSKGHESQILVNSLEFIDVIFDEQEEPVKEEPVKEEPKPVAKTTRRSR